MVGVDREQIEISGDDCVGSAGVGERYEVVVARITAHGRRSVLRIGKQDRLRGQVRENRRCLRGTRESGRLADMRLGSMRAQDRRDLSVEVYFDRAKFGALGCVYAERGSDMR